MGKKIFFTTMMTAVLCAGTVSARQLRNNPGSTVFCGGTCGKHIACSIDCFCNIPAGAKSGSCILPPAFKGTK